MAWLEGSALGHVMRDNGVWFYGIINLTHIVGVATLFGSVVILDLRLLGFWPDAPLAAISRPTTRMAAAGFGIAAVSGAGLLATKATEYVRSEERRVGKECRSRWATEHYRKKVNVESSIDMVCRHVTTDV